MIPIWDVDGESAEAIYRRIEAFRPAYVLGYTATLANLADHLLRRNLRLQHRLRAVMTGAETLTPPRRRLIEQYFQAPIINPYGLREIGACIAQNCPASPERFHVNTELVIWETVREDGAPAAPGEIGRVVLTHLHNYVMPFLRYDTGDLAVAGGKQCACGRGFRLVGPIDGRWIECVRTPSEKVISPASLGQYLIVVPGHAEAVWHYQLVQEAPERVRLLVVPAPELGREQRERLREGLGRSLTQFLGDAMTVEVEMVTDIPAEESGKRLVIKANQ